MLDPRFIPVPLSLAGGRKRFLLPSPTDPASRSDKVLRCNFFLHKSSSTTRAGGFCTERIGSSTAWPPSLVDRPEQYRDAVNPSRTKDWTWTLQRRCPQCGFAASEVRSTRSPTRAFVAAEEWVQILRSSPAAAPGRSPTSGPRWKRSARPRRVPLFDQRLMLMLTEEDRSSPTGTRTRPPSPSVPEQDPRSSPTSWSGRGHHGRPHHRAPAGQLDRTGRRSDGASSPSSLCCSTSCTTSCTTCGTSPASGTRPRSCLCE